MFFILIIIEIDSPRTKKFIKSGVREGPDILSKENGENLGKVKSMFNLPYFTFPLYESFASGDRNIQERFRDSPGMINGLIVRKL